MTADWRTELAAARVPTTPRQDAWDGHWQRWRGIALRSGRDQSAAIEIAYTRTEAQWGTRPGNEESKP